MNNANDIDIAKVLVADQAEGEVWARVEQLQQRKPSHGDIGLIRVKSEKELWCHDGDNKSVHPLVDIETDRLRFLFMDLILFHLQVQL